MKHQLILNKIYYGNRFDFTNHCGVSFCGMLFCQVFPHARNNESITLIVRDRPTKNKGERIVQLQTNRGICGVLVSGKWFQIVSETYYYFLKQYGHNKVWVTVAC